MYLFQKFLKQSLPLGGVSSVLGICRPPIFGPCVRKIWYAGAVNGGGWVAPVYAKVVGRITFAATKI